MPRPFPSAAGLASAFSIPILLAFALASTPTATHAQSPGLKLAVGDVGLGIGDVPRIDGLRLNFRDRHLERVCGVNVTLWSPHEIHVMRCIVSSSAVGRLPRPPASGSREVGPRSTCRTS